MRTLKTTIVMMAFAFLSFGNVNGQDNTLAEDLLKTAEAFKDKSIPDSAVVYYEKSALAFQKTGNTEKTINAYNQMGTLLNRQDKYDRAKTYLEKALATKDTSSLAIATTYITLGVTYGALDQFEQSLLYHHKALAIRLLKLGEYSPDVATSYGNIGNVYFRKKEYDEAITAHLKAKQIREKAFGENSVEIIQTYTNLGNAYKEKKRYAKALHYYEKALTNKIKQLGQGHKDLAKYYKNVGEMHHLMGNTLQSDAYRSKAEALEKK